MTEENKDLNQDQEIKDGQDETIKTINNDESDKGADEENKEDKGDGEEDDNYEPEEKEPSTKEYLKKVEIDNEEDDSFDPDDKAKIDKFISKKIQPMEEATFKSAVESDLQSVLTEKPEFKEYESRIRSYINHPSRIGFIKNGLPVKSVVYEAVAPYLMRAGAKAERIVQQKAKDTQIQNNGGRSPNSGGETKDWSKATFEEINNKRNEVFGYNN